MTVGNPFPQSRLYASTRLRLADKAVFSRRARFVLLAIAIVLALFMAKVYYDTNTIEVRYYEISKPSLAEALAGLKIAHLTDLHIGALSEREDTILRIMEGEKPDLILITGDFIDFKGSYGPPLSFFQRLHAPLGVYGGLGNTEYSNENGSCVLCHTGKSMDLKVEEHPVFLRNSSRVVNLGGKVLNIAGTDDPVTKRSDLGASLEGVSGGGPTILLSHSPEIFEEASRDQVDLVLAGHTHGGQIFLTKYLRYVLPLDPVLEFINGFFEKGTTLMYVSRGVGTSVLPFRIGVKPEITFFNFKKQIVSDATSWSSVSSISPRTYFAGLSLSTLLDTFNIFKKLDNRMNSTDSTNSTNSTNSSNSMNSSNPSNPTTLFDFESRAELGSLNWECHKWFELSEENVTSGRHSLKVLLPPGRYPGIDFKEFRRDWFAAGFLKMDVFNPSEEEFKFHIRIDDHKSGWAYAKRFDVNFVLKPGMNNISIPTESIRTNVHSRPLNLKKIERLMVFIPNNPIKRELYIDNIRLE
jgi:predicted MPP superfamily phosphohydrolase